MNIKNMLSEKKQMQEPHLCEMSKKRGETVKTKRLVVAWGEGWAKQALTVNALQRSLVWKLTYGVGRKNYLKSHWIMI